MEELKAPWSLVTPPPGRYWVALWRKDEGGWTPRPMLADHFIHNKRPMIHVLSPPQPALGYETGEEYVLGHPECEPMAWAPCEPPEVA
jgi:hypothetical protein